MLKIDDKESRCEFSKNKNPKADREIKKNRGSINDFCYNFLQNFSENAKLMHSVIKKFAKGTDRKTACKQYFVSLVSCLETFFRDTFIYIHTADNNLMDSLCKRFAESDLPEDSDLT